MLGTVPGAGVDLSCRIEGRGHAVVVVHDIGSSMAEAGELAMLPPTIGNLRFLLEHGSIDAAMAAAQQVGVPTPVQPRLRYGADGKVTGVVMPWDQGYNQLEG